MKHQTLSRLRVKSRFTLLPKTSGRNNIGRITARHIGGRHKRFYRAIDFCRDKDAIAGRVVGFSYDPNRNVHISLITYADGEKRYILTPVGLQIGDTVVSSDSCEIRSGNCLSLARIPIGTVIHNVELAHGKGGQLVRGAGGGASVLAREGGFVHVRLPSGEVRRIPQDCRATVGQVANVEWKNRTFGTAGALRRRGRRPNVRGTAQHPGSHPHGGGEGRSGEGLKQAKTPWGKPARGLRTRKRKKYSDAFILSKRKK